ncbi:MAG: biopolymer transporter ExbD [Mailhella sp.]|nr:biopolymer transporter ExbD [Mailhella sp.]
MIDFRRPRGEGDGFDLAPFMDVIVILLIFFIIASAFAVRGLDLDLPPAHTSEALSGRVVEITLADDGSYTCDGVPVSPADLRYRLQDIVRGFRKDPGQLVLKSSPKAPVDALIRLVDEVRMLGGEKLMIATSRPGERRP